MATGGRQTRLTEPVAKAIVAAVAAGSKVGPAAAALGLTPRVATNWVRRGNQEATRLRALNHDPDQLPHDHPAIDDTTRRFFLFARAVEQAEQQAINQLAQALHTIATEGVTMTEVTVEQALDPETGDPIPGGRRKTVTRTAPDPATLRWVAERTDRDRFHLPQQVTVTGPNGTPLQIMGFSEHQADALATLLQTYTEALTRSLPPKMRARLTGAVPKALTEALDAIETPPPTPEVPS